MPWLALTLEVEAGAADAVSDALLDAGAQSVSAENLEHECTTLQALVGIAADPARIVQRAALAAGLAATPAFAVRQVEDEDWVRRTQAQFAPMKIGTRLWVGPSWHEPPKDRVAVRVDPGLAFGTGAHPTTRLVLSFLEQRIRGGESVLDYGCGSGILALAAAKLGASRVDAVDVDEQAVRTTLDNATANRVRLRAWLPEALPEGRYDIVVSNILAQPLVLLAPLLAARSETGAALALAGILNSQAGEVAAAYSDSYDVRVEASEEGWALLCGVRR